MKTNKQRIPKNESFKKVRPDKKFNKDHRERKNENKNESKVVNSKSNLEDTDWLEGRNSVMEAIKSGREINKILVSKGSKEGSINKIISLARERKIVVQEVDRNKLDSISQTSSHQGIIAYVSAKEYVEVEDIIAIARERKEDVFILILDEITDPHNLGSILRTADSSGVHGVIIPKRRSIALNSAVSKSSAGAIEYVPVARVNSIANVIDDLKKENIWVIGTDAEGEKTMYETDLKGNLAIVIGSEGEGISRLVKERCDFLVNIPMKGKISSLNAGVAGAVVIYEALRQRL